MCKCVAVHFSFTILTVHFYRTVKINDGLRAEQHTHTEGWQHLGPVARLGMDCNPNIDTYWIQSTLNYVYVLKGHFDAILYEVRSQEGFQCNKNNLLMCKCNYIKRLA